MKCRKLLEEPSLPEETWLPGPDTQSPPGQTCHPPAVGTATDSTCTHICFFSVPLALRVFTAQVAGLYRTSRLTELRNQALH